MNLLYGTVLCNARAMGEFGAISVVSGHIRGSTNTLLLHVDILDNEYNFATAFAVVSLLALLALVTIALKAFFEFRNKQQMEYANEHRSTLPFLAIWKFCRVARRQP